MNLGSQNIAMALSRHWEERENFCLIKNYERFSQCKINNNFLLLEKQYWLTQGLHWMMLKGKYTITEKNWSLFKESNYKLCQESSYDIWKVTMDNCLCYRKTRKKAEKRKYQRIDETNSKMIDLNSTIFTFLYKCTEQSKQRQRWTDWITKNDPNIFFL